MNNTAELLHQDNGSDEEYHPLVACAALDILGVKNLMTRSDSGRMAMDITRKFVRNACASGYYSATDLDSKVGDFYRTAAYFGDSVYLFADPGVGIAQQISLLSARVSSLIAMGLWGDVRFLARAAIATGDLRIVTIATDCGQHEIRVGTAMIRAHVLESAQAWIGAALEIDDPAHLSAEGARWAFDYLVPLKDSIHIAGRVHALNWIGSGIEKPVVVETLRKTVDQVGADPQAAGKLANTESFVDAVYASGRFAPFDVPVELVNRVCPPLLVVPDGGYPVNDVIVDRPDDAVVLARQ
jgi:hypothetical protein